MMGSIVLLPRGERLGSLFGEIAQNLSKDFHVHIPILGSKQLSLFESSAKFFERIPNVTVYDLQSTFESRLYPADEIKGIEREVGLNLFHAASNYLLYKRYAKSYYKNWHGMYDDRKDLQKEFVGSYYFFRDLYNKVEPKLVFCEMPDLVCHRVAMALAFKKGFFETHVNLMGAMGLNGFFLASGSNNINPLLKYFYDHSANYSEDIEKQVTHFTQSLSENNAKENPYIRYLRNGSSNYLKRFTLQKVKHAKLKDVPSLVHRETKRLANLRWLEKMFHKELPQEPYILFMLHHQPEATTMLAAPHLVEQNALVEQLAIRAPNGYKIVVKENPRTFGLRGKEYFGPLSELDNVHLLHPSFDNAKVLSQCAGMVVINGTAGLEGIFLKKPVIALTKNYYSFYPGVSEIRDIKEAFDILETEPTYKQDEELSKFKKAFFESYIPFEKTLKGSPWPPPKEGGEVFAKGIKRFLSIVEQNRLKPSQFGLLP